MLQRALDLLVPPACVACRTTGSWPLCGDCRRALPHLGVALCGRCGLPVPCGRRCPAAAAAFDAAWAPLAHEGAARALVLALKYKGGRALAQALAAPIAAGVPAGLVAPDALLVAVPGDPRRTRRRGYNPAAELARALAPRLQLGLGAPLRMRAPARSQTAAGTRARRLSAGAGTVGAQGVVATHCVLVDDVHTTGATLHHCAAALKSAGALRVTALTATRSLREGLRVGGRISHLCVLTHGRTMANPRPANRKGPDADRAKGS